MLLDTQPTAPLILVADDEDSSRLLLRRMLESESYQVEESLDGLDTLQKCAELRPSLVLLDVMMPGLDGFDVCRQLQTMGTSGNVPVLLITALDDAEAIDQGFAAGAVDYITKPIQWPVLRHRIHNLLEIVQTRRKLEEERNLLRTLVDTLPDLIFVKDRQGRFLLANIALAATLGVRTPDDLIGRSDRDFSPPHIVANYRADDEAVTNTGQPLLDREEPHVSLEDKPKWISTTKVPLRDVSGQVTGVIAISRDITAKKQADEDLRRAEGAEREQYLLAESLRDSATALTSSLELDVVAARILENVGRIIPHETANIMLIDGENARIAFWRGYTPTQEELLRTVRVPLETMNLHQMLTTQAPLLVADTQTFPGWRVWPEMAWIRSTAGTPIQAHGSVIGFLNVDSRDPGFFTDGHLERLKAFGDQAAIAIENARLYDQLRRYAADLEVRVEERTAELRLVKDYVEAILNHSSDGILVTRADGRIQQANPAFARLFGMKPDQQPDFRLTQLAQPAEVEKLNTALSSVVASQQPVRVEIEAWDNEKRPLSIDIALSPLVGHKPWNIVCSIRDITDRKRIEEALAHERDLLQALMDNIPDTIYFKDTTSRFTRINRALADFFHLGSPDEALGKTDFDLQPDTISEPAYAEERQLVETGQPVLDRVEYNPFSDGQDRWYSVTKVPIRDRTDQVIGLVGISRNITPQLRLESELRQALEQQKSINTLKSQFISTVSHEFRTPLTTISTSAQLVKLALDRNMPAEQSQKYLDRLNQAVELMVQLLEEVLTIGRAEAGRQQFVPEPLDLEAFCRELVEEMQATYSPRHTILCSSPGTDCPVVADRQLLRQIVGNLLSNAVKYSPQGGLVCLEVDCQDGYARIEITDQGIGIPEVDQGHLFETFFRASNVKHIAGTGLGLAIVKQAVELHRGSVAVHSMPGMGTTFTVSIPIEHS